MQELHDATPLPCFALIPFKGLFPAIFFLLILEASGAPLQFLAYETQDDVSSRALKARHGYFNQLAIDCYSVDSQGKIIGSAPTGDLDFARSQKMAIFATMSNFADKDFDGDLAHGIITSGPATQTFLEDALKILAAERYVGLNLDFESIRSEDRVAFTTFVESISKAMRHAGFLTVISVPAEHKDDPADSWTGAFDLKALGSSADLLQVMTYDENGPWGKPGPVAGLDWVEAAIRYTVSVVPARKISLGLPAFAYDWDLSDHLRNRQLDWTEVLPIREKVGGVIHWDAASSSPNFTYTQKGHRHVVWYESEESIGLKARLVATYQLAGISVWALGQENEAFWQAMHL